VRREKVPGQIPHALNLRLTMDGMNERLDDEKRSVQAGKTIGGPVFFWFANGTDTTNM